MGTIPFSDYIASRPAATTPVDTTDRLLILQGGEVKLVPSADTGLPQGVTTEIINPDITPITILPTSGEIVYYKADGSSALCQFAVAVVGQTMCQELIDGLDLGSIRVKLIGSNWYKIG